MSESTRQTTPPSPPWGVRRISEAGELRALAHPLRLAILDLLSEGPLTASQCAVRLGESPANCSYHLRQLAKYGHVFAAEGGRGRERPWRMRSEGISWDEQSPAGRSAGAALAEVVDNHRFEAWRRYRRGQYAEPKSWQQAALSTDIVEWMTADELQDLTHGIYELFASFHARRDDESLRPADARAVRFFAYAYGGSAGPLDASEIPGAGDLATASAADDS